MEEIRLTSLAGLLFTSLAWLLFTRLYTSQVVQDIFHQHYETGADIAKKNPTVTNQPFSSLLQAAGATCKLHSAHKKDSCAGDHESRIENPPK